MGFSLTIQEGKELGRQFQFDQPEVSIGRTAENDIVLYDAGVSRRHAVIRNEGGRVVVRDEGSANGTQLNGSPIVGEGELQNGDLLSVGPVVFAVEIAAQEDGSTRILDVSTLAPPAPPKKSTALAKPSPKASPQQAEQQRRPTTAMPAQRPKPVAKGASARPGKAAPPMAASQRARIQRNATGFKAKLDLFFMDKPPAAKKAAIGSVALLGLLAIGGIVTVALPKGSKGISRGDASKERFLIAEGRPGADVYGLGDSLGVTIPTRDELHFTFEYSDTIPVVIYLRFESTAIETKDEVDISLNETHIGNVTAGFGDYSKEQRIKLPKKYLKSGEKNEILFDNTHNPPGSDTWAISKARLLMKPLPTGTNAELMAEARKLYALAENKMVDKELGPANRYEAMRALDKALLFLEAIEPKPDLYNLVQQTAREVDRDLDNMCNKILLGAKKFEELKKFDLALREYKTGLQWFPGDDHPCNPKIKETIERYGGSADDGK